MTKVEIITETMEFYSHDTSRRSKNDVGLCVYNGEGGNHCAVGRCMLDTYRAQGTDLKVDSYVTAELLSHELDLNSIDDALEEVYRGHELDFWANLQSFHDLDQHWNESGGLSEAGKCKFEFLINKYKENSVVRRWISKP